jgi:uncharacterized membrane protein
MFASHFFLLDLHLIVKMQALHSSGMSVNLHGVIFQKIRLFIGFASCLVLASFLHGLPLTLKADVRSMLLQNIGRLLLDYTAPHTRRQYTS